MSFLARRFMAHNCQTHLHIQANLHLRACLQPPFSYVCSRQLTFSYFPVLSKTFSLRTRPFTFPYQL